MYSYNNFYFEENDFFDFNYIFLLKIYVITHTLLKAYVITYTAKTHLPCSIFRYFSQVYYCFNSLLFGASVVLVTWLSKYSKYFETASHTSYTCSLSRFICGFEKYDRSKYLSKLFTLMWASVELMVWPCVCVHLACWNPLSFLEWLQEKYSGFSILTYCNEVLYTIIIAESTRKVCVVI